MDTFQLKMQINTLTYIIRNNNNFSPILNDKILFLMNKLTAEDFNQWKENAKSITRENKIFTIEELKTYNGLDGKPTYVSIDGFVYDISGNPLWVDGHHFGLMAGQELSNDFNNCHKSSNLLSNLKKVGTLAP